MALNAESGFAVPLEYRHWQDVIGTPSEPYERPLAYAEVSRFEVKMRPDLLEHSTDLFEEEEIEYWVLGYRDVQKYAVELRRAATSRLVLTPESDEQRAERVLTQAIREVFTAPQRRGLQRRLEETAYIFLRTERPQAAKLAIAAAVEIADSDPVLLPRNPFVRLLMQRSISARDPDRARRGRPLADRPQPLQRAGRVARRRATVTGAGQPAPAACRAPRIGPHRWGASRASRAKG